jgi:mannose-6-phosphate isomerase class I
VHPNAQGLTARSGHRFGSNGDCRSWKSKTYDDASHRLEIAVIATDFNLIRGFSAKAGYWLCSSRLKT